jgi:hypothetical protein
VNTGDFDNDTIADVLWQNDQDGRTAIWFMGANAVLENVGYIQENDEVLIPTPNTNLWPAVGSADMNGDGNLDIVWRNTEEDLSAIWLLPGTRGTNILSPDSVGTRGINILPDGGIFVSNAQDQRAKTGTTSSDLVGLGDFNGDGQTDFLYRDIPQNLTTVWLMNGTTLAQSISLPGLSDPLDPAASATVGDFNGDNIDDIVWRYAPTDTTVLWVLSTTGNQIQVTPNTLPQTGFTTWLVRDAADFNNDLTDDLLWQSSDLNQQAIWLMQNGTLQESFDMEYDLPPTLSSQLAQPGGEGWILEGANNFGPVPT